MVRFFNRSETVQLFTYATQSHREMCQRFVVSKANQAGFDGCYVFEAEQVCESGKYNTAGFNEQMWLKLDGLASIPIGTKACYVDADCLILPGLRQWCESWLSSNDAIGHGNDAGLFCMGTLVFEQSQRTVDWWKFIRQLAWITKLHDQQSVNGLMRNAKQVPVGMAFLPSEVFANFSYGGCREHWSGEPFAVPDGCLCWHANFCIGLEMKTQMLGKVEKWAAKS